MDRLARLSLALLSSVAIVGCTGREKLRAEPCLGVAEVERFSTGFDSGDYDLFDFDERSADPAVWDQIEVTDGSATLLSFEKSAATITIYNDAIADVWVLPSRYWPLSHISAHLEPTIEVLLGAGFVNVAGDRARFLSTTRDESYRALDFRKGDYEVRLSIHLDDAGEFYKANHIFRSVDTCRSPAIKARMVELPPPTLTP